MMVERQLAAEGGRARIGREKFVERVWEWTQHYGGAILDQMKRLGGERGLVARVLHHGRGLRSLCAKPSSGDEQGLIYRGAYIVNWCPRCQTAIRDLEVAHEEQQGKLWEIRYPVMSGADPDQVTALFVTVATTRPETMLGDTAVAVHPDG